MANYPTTDYTFEALKNLGAETHFVSFNSIFNEVKRIRLVKNLKSEDKNTRGRVRRSLVNTKKIAEVRGSEQSKKLSINIKYPEYMVKYEKYIQISTAGSINVKDVENNKFKLLKVQ